MLCSHGCLYIIGSISLKCTLDLEETPCLGVCEVSTLFLQLFLSYGNLAPHLIVASRDGERRGGFRTNGAVDPPPYTWGEAILGHVESLELPCGFCPQLSTAAREEGAWQC